MTNWKEILTVRTAMKTHISILCLIVAALAVLSSPVHGQRRRSPKRPATPASRQPPTPQKEFITEALPNFNTFEDGVYKNEYFGLELTVPEGWRVADDESSKQLNRKGAEVMAGDSQDMKKLLREAEGQTINLFTLGKLPQPGSEGGTVSIVGAAEPVPAWLVRTGEEYLVQVRRLLERTAVKPEFEGPVTKEKIGGVEFATMHLRMNYYGTYVTQKLSATIRKGHAIILTRAYIDEQGAQAINEVIKTIKFK